METTNRSYDGWIGRDAYDSTGDKLGRIEDVFYDDQTGRPEWLAVKTGLFGANRTFVPIHGSQPLGDDDGNLRLAFDKATVKDAPNIDPEGHMSPTEEAELWKHYGYDYSQRDYGKASAGDRADKDYTFSRWDREQKNWGEEHRLEEHTEEVPVHASVEIPIDTTVRLRRYQTQHQRTETRQVEVPVTETEEHVEVADVDADAKIGKSQVRIEDDDTTTRRK
jgi:sporulation protein YlmC with PRC-barrel domain